MRKLIDWDFWLTPEEYVVEILTYLLLLLLSMDAVLFFLAAIE